MDTPMMSRRITWNWTYCKLWLMGIFKGSFQCCVFRLISDQSSWFVSLYLSFFLKLCWLWEVFCSCKSSQWKSRSRFAGWGSCILLVMFNQKVLGSSLLDMKTESTLSTKPLSLWKIDVSDSVSRHQVRLWNLKASCIPFFVSYLLCWSCSQSYSNSHEWIWMDRPGLKIHLDTTLGLGLWWP